MTSAASAASADSAARRAAPAAERPRMPAEYGMPTTTDGLLDWAPLDERLREAKVYWVVTSGADGQPRARPVDGLWVDGALYVGGSPETRWARDLEANQLVSVHLDGGFEVLILEGEADVLETGVEPAVAQRLAAESKRKYPGYGVKAADYIGRPAGFAVRPRIALAWKSFPTDLTKFRFG